MRLLHFNLFLANTLKSYSLKHQNSQGSFEWGSTSVTLVGLTRLGSTKLIFLFTVSQFVSVRHVNGVSASVPSLILRMAFISLFLRYIFAEGLRIAFLTKLLPSSSCLKPLCFSAAFLQGFVSKSIVACMATHFDMPKPMFVQED